jgi:DNA-binding winged helix-turn-helix (wHTH) protein
MSLPVSIQIAPSAADAAAFQFDNFTYLAQQALLLRDSVAVRIGSKALGILECLIEQAVEVVKKRTISRRFWPTTVVTEVSLRVHLMDLRKALGNGQNGARYIINVPGRGYRFVSPVHRTPATNRNGKPPIAASHNEAAGQNPLFDREGELARLMAGRSDHRQTWRAEVGAAIAALTQLLDASDLTLQPDG